MLFSCSNQDVHKCQWSQLNYTEPTCFKAGEAKYKCIFCDKTKTVSINKLNHDFVTIEVDDNSSLAECTNCKSKIAINPTHVEHDLEYYSSSGNSITLKCTICKQTKSYSGTLGWKRISGMDVYGISTDDAFFELSAPIGIEGPAGGIIFYDCDKDNDKFKNDGFVSTECGWRYLETSKNYLSIQNGEPSIEKPTKAKFIQGYFRKGSEDDNLRVNGTTSYKFANCTVDTLGYGKSNTEKLVNAYKENGLYCYEDANGDATTTECAVLLCNALVHSNNGYTYSDWFLPSAYEVRQAFYELSENPEFLSNTTKEATISTSSEKSEAKITLNEKSYAGSEVMHNFNTSNMKTSSKIRSTALYVLPMRQVPCKTEV